MVPMISPNGQPGDIPFEKMRDAMTAGFKPAVIMKSPDGSKSGYIPADKTQEASKAGFKIVPFEQQETQHDGFWSAIGKDLAGIPKGLAATVAEPFRKASIGPLARGQEFQAQQQQMGEDAARRKAEGYGLLYRTAAPIGENLVGVNAKGMEQSAKEGDVGGVMGHAAAVPAVMAATEGLAKGTPPVVEALKSSTAPARTVIAERSLAKLIKPNAADLKFGRNPTGAIVREGITANSLPELGQKVYAQARTVGAEIDKTLQNSPVANKTIDLTDALSPINERMKTAVANGDKAMYDRLSDLKQQLTKEWAENPKTGSIEPVGDRNLQMTPMQATEFKRQIGDMTRWQGADPFENELNATKAEIFGKIKQKVNQSVPGIANLNNRYADLVSAGKAIERRIPVDARNAEFSLSDIATGGFALHAGGPAALATVAGKKILSSTAFKTRAAQVISPQAP